MDTVISRMMRLLGVIVVMGFATSGLLCAQLKHWDGAVAFLIYGAIAAGLFTAIWVVGGLQILDKIGKGKKRTDITKQRIVGVSTGVLALIVAAGFFTAGIAATNATDNTYALVLEVFGALATAALCAGWCFADYYFLDSNR
jgi:hypothetical protein